MNGRLLAGALALAASMMVIGGTALAKTPAPAKSTVHYYVALGDSLSVGYQPNSAGVGKETTQGYVNDIYATAKTKVKNLKLVQFGCPGDTTTSMLTGKGNALAAKLYKCNLTDGSQLKAAVAFLKAHDVKGEVPLITIDIGANDVDSCAGDAAGGISAVEACVGKGVATIGANTPKILSAIHKAAPTGSTLAAMNLYDPILADELSTDTSQQSLGTLSLALVKSVNATITKADKANGFLTADAADAFDTYDTTAVTTTGTTLASSGLSTVPTNVLNICNLTWMCAAPPVGPNIHANKIGYTTIAKAFAAVLPKSL